MKISRLAIAVFALAFMPSVFTTNAADNLPAAPPAQGSAATQANPQPLQVPKSETENPGAKKELRKRTQAKQGSGPPDIHALHPKSK